LLGANILYVYLSPLATLPPAVDSLQEKEEENRGFFA
jgi:hypothetical protein